MPKPPTFYQFFPWILNRMEKRQASKEKLSEIMWRIFWKALPDWQSPGDRTCDFGSDHAQPR